MMTERTPVMNWNVTGCDVSGDRADRDDTRVVVKGGHLDGVEDMCM